MANSAVSLWHRIWTRLSSAPHDGSLDADRQPGTFARFNAWVGTALGVDVVTAAPPVLLGLLLVLTLQPGSVPDPLGVGDHRAWTVLVGALGVPSLLVLRASGAIVRTPIDGWLTAVLVIAVIGWPWSASWLTTLFWLAAFTANIVVFYASVGLVRRDERAGRVMLVASVAGIFLVQILAFSYHLGEGLLNRPTSYLVPAAWSGYPEIGFLAAVLLAILLAVLQSARRLPTLLALGWLTTLALVALVFLYSRTSWIAAAAVFGLTLIDSWRRGSRRLALGVICALTIVGGTVVTFNPTVQRIALGMVGVLDVISPTPGTTVYIATPDQRFDLWGRTARMIVDHPIVGVGLGNFQQVFETVYNPEINNDGRRGGHAHNLWLHYTAELGVPGGIVYLVLWGVLLHQSWKRRHNLVGRAAFYVLVSVAVRQLADNVFYSPGGAPGRLETLTWMWAAAAMADERPASGLEPRSPGAARRTISRHRSSPAAP